VDILITKGGLFPAAKTGLKSSEMVAKSDYFGAQPLYEKFIESANNLNTKGGIGGPAIGVGHTALKDEFGKVGNGEETFKEALTNTSAKLKKAAVDKGLSVQ
jgi:multiple sugar transport system substrate-binding protein